MTEPREPIDPATVMAEHQRWPGGDWCQECSRAGYTPWPCRPYIEAKQTRALSEQTRS